jgi:hypothetical protein
MKGLSSVIVALAAFGCVATAVAGRTSLYEVFNSANADLAKCGARSRPLATWQHGTTPCWLRTVEG